MIAIILAKLIVVFPFIMVVWQFRRAQRRKTLEAYSYWHLGLAGYGLFIPWVQGLLLDGVGILWAICFAGSLASIFLDGIKLRRKTKQIEAAIKTLNHSIEAICLLNESNCYPNEIQEYLQKARKP